MAGILDSVDQRTQLVGENRLEILMFRLAGRQLFAINVFKVQEVLQMPKLTLMPQRHRFVCGVVNLRGQTLPVIDLSQAIGMRPLVPDERSTIIVTEYNRSVQAFLVGSVDRILNLNWESIQPPPGGAGRQHYLTAITKVEDQIVEIIDVEKVLAEIVPMSTKVSAEKLADPLLEKARGREVLLVDDSQVALQQTLNVLRQLGFDCTAVRSGHAALEQLHEYHQAGMPFELLVSDIEMPELDGYSLVQEIRRSPDIAGTYVLLHTSLDSTMNTEKARSVGANAVLTKFSSVDLSQALLDAFRKMDGQA